MFFDANILPKKDEDLLNEMGSVLGARKYLVEGIVSFNMYLMGYEMSDRGKSVSRIAESARVVQCHTAIEKYGYDIRSLEGADRLEAEKNLGVDKK